MKTPIIVTARELPAALIVHLQTLGEVRCYDPENPEESLKDASVWLGTAVDPVRADVIARFPESLGLIANLGVGTDNIDLKAAAEAGLQVSNTPVVTEDTADLTFALLLSTCRRLNESEQPLRTGDWATGASILGRRVHGKSLGIVGFGAIGQAVARRARGFDMRVCYHGPSRKAEVEGDTDAKFCATLDELLAMSDIVSLNCPLTDETRHLINEQTLASMKSGAILINTGRGPLVHEEALVSALKSGHLGGAGLDVFEFEPAVTPALCELPNVTLLPHVGSATGECRTEIVLRGLGNIRTFLETGKVLDPCVA